MNFLISRVDSWIAFSFSPSIATSQGWRFLSFTAVTRRAARAVHRRFYYRCPSPLSLPPSAAAFIATVYCSNYRRFHRLRSSIHHRCFQVL
ncbi:hypothetical protein U1Q18_007621 [Sarracenia purpurea var. burkii]